MGKVPGEWPPPEFQHSELRSNASIRLVQIHPELVGGEISCTLQHFETDSQSCPDYTALSYVWGNSNPTHIIHINGMVRWIHRSLWLLLRHIQSAACQGPGHTWYWTDLLCIDQAHHSEKNEQIARMGDIYAQAASVTSWLGNSNKTVEALRVFVEMPDGIDTASEPRYTWRSPESERIHRACDQLAFQEPYWGRVWIVQEVACARNCIVASGNVSLSFEDLLHRMEVAMARTVRFNNTSDRDRTMQRMNSFASLRASIQGSRPVRILELIQKTSFCQATRDQDKIYGLLGLASRLDPGFDPTALEIAQHKTLVDIWWDMLFLILQQDSHISSVRDDIGIMESLVDKLPLNRMPSAREMDSSNRRALAKTICLVSEAAYSNSSQKFLGLQNGIRRMELEFAWSIVTTHVLSQQQHDPCLQRSLGWAVYAALRFTSWHDDRAATSLTLPLGWFCAVHSPDAPSEITKKHGIIKPLSLLALGCIPSRHIYCFAAQDDGIHCDFSSAVLEIESLGITCLVSGSSSKSEVAFYCDCCDLSTEGPYSRIEPISDH